MNFNPSTAGTTHLAPDGERDSFAGWDYQDFRWRDRFTFTQMDDGGQGRNSDPLTLHKHLYANGDSANNSDPTGMFSVVDVAMANGIQNLVMGLQFTGFGAAHHTAQGIEAGQNADQIFKNFVIDQAIGVGIGLGIGAALGAVGALRNGISVDTSLFSKIRSVSGPVGQPVGVLSGGQRNTFRSWLDSIGLLGSGRTLSGARSAEGMLIPRRLLPSEIATLSQELKAEVAVVLRRNNGVNTWTLHVGEINKVRFTMDKDTYLIYHTHPRGGPAASTQDMETLIDLAWLQQNGGNPQQKRSIIVPVGGKPFAFSTDVDNIPIP